LLQRVLVAIGTSRHFGSAQLLGRFWGKADINPGRSQNRIYEYTP
jgi:hypothetical protein